MYGCFAYKWVFVPHACLVSIEAKRGCHMLWSWSDSRKLPYKYLELNQVLWNSSQCWNCWATSSGPAELVYIIYNTHRTFTNWVSRCLFKKLLIFYRHPLPSPTLFPLPPHLNLLPHYSPFPLHLTGFYCPYPWDRSSPSHNGPFLAACILQVLRIKHSNLKIQTGIITWDPCLFWVWVPHSV